MTTSYQQDDVTPTSQAPSHHIHLDDGAGNKVLFNLVRAAGSDPITHKTLFEPDPEGLSRNTFPNQAIRMTNAGGEYADLQPPFQPYEQNDWSGGRGMKYWHKDKTRFEDGNLFSPVENQLILPGLPGYAGGQLGGDAPHEDYALMPNPDSTLVKYLDIYGAARYVARQFAPIYTFDCDSLILPLALIGTAPGNLRVDIYSDSGSNTPNASLANATLTSADFGTEEQFKQYRLTLNTTLTLTASTFYWIVVSSVTDGDSANYWQILAEALSALSATQSTNGTSWTPVSPYRAPCAILCDANADDRRYTFFEYKRQLYAVSKPQDGSGFGVIYMNGWRGTADSNSGALTKLKDSTQTGWSIGTPNTDGIVLITNGPGSEEAQPWRKIVGSASGQLTVSPAWKTTHTTDTEYVVLGSKFWTALQTVYAKLTDVHVAGEFVYFSFGNDAAMWRYRAYNNAGTWTNSFTVESVTKAHRVTTIPDATSPKQILYAYNNSHPLGPVYWKMLIPPASGDLYREIGEIQPTDVPFNDKSITNVTQAVGEFGTKITMASGFTTGLIATKDLESPLTIAQGQKIAALIKSDVAVTTGQLTMRLSSRPWLQQQNSGNQHKQLADFAYARIAQRPTLVKYAATYNNSTGATTDKPEIYDGQEDTSNTIPLTSNIQLLVMADSPFNWMEAHITVANTNTPITLTMEYFNGKDFTLHTITGNFGGVANTPFGATGEQTITFNLPEDWAPYTIDGNTGYAVLLICSGTITAETAVSDFEVKNTEAYEYVSLGYAKDAVTTYPSRVTLTTSDRLIIGMANNPFDGISIDVGSTPNAVAASLTGRYFSGETTGALASGITDGTASGGATLAQDGTITFTAPSDWQKLSLDGNAAYYIFLQPSADLTANIDLNEISVLLTESTYDVDCILAANTWTWVVGSASPGSKPPDGMIVRNVSFILNSDLGAQNLELKDGIHLISPYPEYRSLGGYRATNIVAYGQGQEILQPYILFEARRLHRIDTLNNDLLVPVLVTAMETLADESNGRAAAHSGVYLYFNMGPRLMRYFDGSLESVGPDLDDGLPYDKQGVISSVIPYAGDQVIYAVNAAERDPLFTSAVYVRSGSGVHELYRAPVGEPIHNLRIQVVPGMEADRLWIAVNTQLVWVPIPSYTRNPLKDLDADLVSNYYYLHEGYLTAGRLTDGASGLTKVFVSMVLVTENLRTSTTAPCWLDIYYRVDDDTAWTKITTQITTSPVQEVSLGYVSCREFQYRIRAHSFGGIKYTPVIKSVYVKGLTIYPASYVYSVQGMLGDTLLDLEGRPHAHTASTEITLLDGWRNTGAPLTLTDLYTPWSSRTVMIQSLNYRPYAINTKGKHIEQYIFDATLLDVTV